MSFPRMAALALALAVLPLSGLPEAAGNEQLKGKTYYFGTSAPRTNISFTSDAEIELIQGTTNQLDPHFSKITVDASGTKAKGSLRVAVSDLKTGIGLRDEHLRSATWLDAEKHPWVTVEITEASEDKDGRTWGYKGRITIKGVTRDIAGKVRVRALPTTIKGLGPGEWVRVRAKFDVDITKHGVEIPEQVGAKVSRVWQIGVDVYGTTAAPKPRK